MAKKTLLTVVKNPDGIGWEEIPIPVPLPEAIYPVGSVFLLTTTDNPATLLGYGTWTAHGKDKIGTPKIDIYVWERTA